MGGEKKPQPSLRPCDRAAVAYRSEDPLENLKIRVQLKSLSAPVKATPEPQPEQEPEAEEAPEQGEEDDEDEAGNEEDEEANEDAEPEPVRASMALSPSRSG